MPDDISADIAIIFGESHDVDESYDDLKQHFESVEYAATFECRYCMPYEDNRPIFICRRQKGSLRDLWPELKNYN